MLKIADLAFRSDTGRQRHANEDSYFARAPVFLVADGMGGAQAGRWRRRLPRTPSSATSRTGPPRRSFARRSSRPTARSTISARSDPSRAGMGTTITAAMLNAESDEVAIGHVGDSRAYRLRKGKLELLTRDHSLVEEMRRKGQITDEQAEGHPQRSIITRALGPEAEVDVDVQTVQALPGDVFLLCSDGLTTMIDEARIEGLLIGGALARGRGPGADRRRQPRGRQGQHHRRRVSP